MAQMLQHPTKPTLDSSLWASEASSPPSPSPSASEPSSARTLNGAGIVVLRSPPATLAVADEQAAEESRIGMLPGASIKRQCIIIPGEYRSAEPSSSRCSDEVHSGRRPPLALIDTSAALLKEAQAAATATAGTHLATPTDSNAGRCGSFDHQNGDGVLLFSQKSEPHSREPVATAPVAAPAAQRRRQPLKILSGSSTKAAYCAPSPSQLVGGPSSPSPAPASGTIALSSKDMLRRTRSQSPTPQSLAHGLLSMSDPEILTGASLPSTAFSDSIVGS
ncbi:hypothetical protein LPJ56_006554, partial [Coemansia sp. RSA 2599]